MKAKRKQGRPLNSSKGLAVKVTKTVKADPAVWQGLDTLVGCIGGNRNALIESTLVNLLAEHNIKLEKQVWAKNCASF